MSVSHLLHAPLIPKLGLILTTMMNGFTYFNGKIFLLCIVASIIPCCYSEAYASPDMRSLNLFNLVGKSGIRGAPYPDFRYTTWDQLDEPSKLAASVLGYTSGVESWDTPGAADIENKAFQSLSQIQKQAAERLGFTEHVWDCYVNHYRSFPWSFLEEIGLAKHLSTIGWTQEQWDNIDNTDDIPEAEEKNWFELTTEEQIAAKELCWFRFTWDYRQLSDWIYYPDFRYLPWDEKDLVFREVASGELNYTEQTWNNPFSADIEYISWFFLYEEEQQAAQSLGFTEANWDCYVNHYFDFSWEELGEYNLLKYFIDLGYTQERWESDDVNDIPESFLSMWHALTVSEKRAAEELCWFRNIWDREPIQEWITYPEFRYAPWDLLDEIFRANAVILGYTKETWDNPGTAEIEKLSSAKLTQEQIDVVADMGFTTKVWDCYINHYVGASWEELDTTLNVQGFYIDLGWNEELFNSIDEKPESDEKYWFDLTYAEQQAAQEICWFPEIWDGLNLSEWSPATAAPSVSMSPSQSSPPSTSAYPSQLPTQSIAPTLSVAPSETVQPSVAPSVSLSPSTSPSEYPSVSPSMSLSPSTSPAPTLLSTTTEPSIPPSTSPTKEVINWMSLYPDYRYGQWQYQPDEIKKAATTLLYTQSTWDIPGTDDIEKIAFASLNEDQQQAALSMGFTGDVWDCYINHYRGYSWEALEDVNVQQHMILLGWTKDSWPGTAAASKTMGMDSDKKWIDLTPAEQEAANSICYFREIWDGQNLNTWTGEPLSPIIFPRVRYNYVWDELTSNSKEDAETLLYTEETWNQPETNELEKLSFSELTSSQQDAALSLGMKEIVWDCYQSHYQTYDWSELEVEEVQSAFIALGWTETMWNSTDSESSVPETDEKGWEELTTEERKAAEEICYFQELWDGLNLKDFNKRTPSGLEKESGVAKTLSTRFPSIATCLSFAASVSTFLM